MSTGLTPALAQPLSLLVVDADPSVREACRMIGSSLGITSHSASSVTAARSELLCTPDIVALDIRISGGGMQFLREIRERLPDASTVIITAGATVQSAVDAMRYGAYDFLSKPFTADDLRSCLSRVAVSSASAKSARALRQQMRVQKGRDNYFAGDSAAMQSVLRLIQKAADSDSSVLIVGEDGTGKELAARMIHRCSKRKTRTFFAVDCTISDVGAFDREVFGSSGEADGASLALPAEGGTAFFSDLADFPLVLQGKLLRCMQRPSSSERRGLELGARIIAGSSRDLQNATRVCEFRQDLFHALNSFKIRLPALRERREDVPAVIAATLQKLARDSGKAIRIEDDLLNMLVEYDWPGNVRELESVLTHCWNASEGATLGAGPAVALLRRTPNIEQAGGEQSVNHGITPLAELEKKAIFEAIKRVGGDKLRAAQCLGIGKTTLYRKLKEYSYDLEIQT